MNKNIKEDESENKQFAVRLNSLHFDSEEEDFENLVLDFCQEEYVMPPHNSTISAYHTSAEDTYSKNEIFKDLVSEQNYFYVNVQNKRKLTRCFSLVDVRSIDKMILAQQLMIVSENLKKRNKDCKRLTEENQQLNILLEQFQTANSRSLLTKVFNYSALRKRSYTPVTGNTAIPEKVKELNLKIVDLEKQFEVKNKKLEELLERSLKEKQFLKMNYYKKSEVQCEIFKEIEEKCKDLEAKLNVERKLREKRETEILDSYNILDRKEKYYKNQIEIKLKQLERLKADHYQEFENLNRIVMQKNEEITFLHQKGCCKHNSENVGLNLQDSQPESFSVDEIKIRHLEQRLGIKTKQLNKANSEVKQLQENHSEYLENIEYQMLIKEKLKDVKENLFELENFIELKKLERSGRNVIEVVSSNRMASIVTEVRKDIGNKEELEYS